MSSLQSVMRVQALFGENAAELASAIFPGRVECIGRTLNSDQRRGMGPI